MQQGRWNALSAARFGGIDINSAENILSLDYGLRKTIDEDFRFAILPVRPCLIFASCTNTYSHLVAWAAAFDSGCPPTDREPAVAL